MLQGRAAEGLRVEHQLNLHLREARNRHKLIDRLTTQSASTEGTMAVFLIDKSAHETPFSCLNSFSHELKYSF